MELLLAPMATLTHRAFRELVKKFGGCDTYYTEMIDAGSFLNGGPFEKFYVDNNPDEKNTIYQIVGGDIDKLSKAARLLSKLPSKGLDINMGCCAPEIAKSGAGITWLGRQGELGELLRTARDAIKCSEDEIGEKRLFSLKCRLSSCDKFSQFKEEDFWKFCDIVSESGVEQLTIHPRVKKEKYKDPPHYRFVEEAAKRYKGAFKIVANGNIMDKESLENIKALCPSVDSFMIARGAAKSPWVFHLLSGGGEGEYYTNNGERKGFSGDAITADFLIAVIDDFIDLVETHLPKEFYKTRLQRFFSYYADNFLFSHYFRTKMINSCEVAPCDVIKNSKDALLSIYKSFSLLDSEGTI